MRTHLMNPRLIRISRLRTQQTRVVLSICLLTFLSSTSNAQLSFFDDFEDGNAIDGNPITWSVGLDSGERSIVDGNYRISSSANASSFADDNGLITADAIVTTQLRIVSGQAFAGVFARSGEDGLSSYFAVIDNAGQFGLGETTADGTIEVKQQIETALNPVESDIMITMNMLGDTITATAWNAGEPMPLDPMVSTIDDTLTSGGLGMLMSPAGFASVDYRFFQVVPEPSSFTLLSVGGLFWLRRRARSIDLL